MKTRICNQCKKPMLNSWNTVTTAGELALFVHMRCEGQFKKENNELIVE